MTRINQKNFKAALIDSGGNQSTIAKKIGVTRGAITHFLNKNPKMRELLEIEAERIIDVAENVIDHDIVTNRDVDSSKWKLTNSKRGKARGYGFKQEMEVTGTAATFNLIEKSVEEIKDAKSKCKPTRTDNKPEASTNPESSK